jgi:hypothetical protein
MTEPRTEADPTARFYGVVDDWLDLPDERDPATLLGMLAASGMSVRAEAAAGPRAIVFDPPQSGDFVEGEDGAMFRVEGESMDGDKTGA